MLRTPIRAPLKVVAAVLPLLMGACSTVVMDPAGDVARQQARLIWWSTGLMLLIIVPVIILTLLFAWKYRAGNKDAAYEPDWDHSTGLELVIWAAPLMIIIALGALTWVSTHLLDPYRPLSRVALGKPVEPATRALEVQVVSLDWKWLFIYPEQGIATVNELVVPVDRPVKFRMTSSSVMNTLWIPSMAGMIYTMPGMETALHGVLNKAGKFEGRSGNYSGAGFSGMTFWTYAVPDARFEQWVAGVRRRPGTLDIATYNRIAAPSENVKPYGFGRVDPRLFARIVAMCTRPGTQCGEHGMGQSHGVRAPANDRPQRPDEAKGALTRDPSELGTSPHLNAPRGKAPGANDPGTDANRNMTMLVPPAPFAAAAAQG
ncbi:ubiquinol oxidase subunit II [Sphingomonas rubra]|uniref:Ubiquinol oxidase polypeptide II n=1 Tax=Sphingomonas rubra TaxID=634430 RepID=A0A1I5QUB4_9SPHN|nr:ubiquinol oxidase subunit II [Sphingomonas rubra]SFP49621.1 cytochrome o ubiquinol oxidase subunit 2 [Sphingomonas rubra]